MHLVGLVVAGQRVHHQVDPEAAGHLALPLTALALKFGPAEYFTLMVFAMTAVSTLAGRSPAKAMISTILGLMIATIGIDLQSGQPRFTAGVPELQDGVGFVLAVVGLFALKGRAGRSARKYAEALTPPAGGAKTPASSVTERERNVATATQQRRNSPNKRAITAA